MNLKKFRDGLDILAPYYDDPSGYHLGAEHDQIYLYATQTPLTPEDAQKMTDLGWFQPEQDDGEPYDPADGWSCFV